MSKRPDISRTSTAQGIDAPVKVVGFHVEGATPSPSSDQNLVQNLKTGSLSPVIIPPTFQGQRTPETSPRHLVSSRRTSIDEQHIVKHGSAAGSQRSSMEGKIGQSGHASKDTNLPESLGISMDNRKSKFQGAVETLPLTPVEDSSILSETGGGDEMHAIEAQEEGMLGSFYRGDHEEMSIDSSITRLAHEQHSEAHRLQDVTSDIAEPQSQPDNTKGKTANKKEMTKAERRALQEAQRAAKAAAKQNPAGSQVKSTQKNAASSKEHAAKDSALRRKHSSTREPDGGKQKGVLQAASFFDHLPSYSAKSLEKFSTLAVEKDVPISCVRLGIKMHKGTIRGTNSRSLALLEMMLSIIPIFEGKDHSFTREFTLAVKNMVAFLVKCRPLSPAVGNVVRSIKAELGHLASQTQLTNEEATDKLKAFIAAFIQDKIVGARQLIARLASEKISDGDIVLTYSRSSTVEQTLIAAAQGGKKFSVVIADARPLLEGKDLLISLLQAGIPCEYLLLNSIETGINQANKVMLGAAAVMSNGALLSRAGTAAVAMSASLAHVPVIVCAETYKFHERVQLDCITNNELGDPLALLSGVDKDHGDVLRRSMESSHEEHILNIVYDTTPAEFISVMMTEVGALPPTSVPVVLREYRSETEMMMT
eukprot:jgi/Picsp_1/3020/NSC_01242-R1_eukaryotic translation initiation factor 2b family protein